MSGIDDVNTIDLVAQEADGTVLLIMFEERNWGSDPDQARQLQDKINLYANYILDGSMVRQYPDLIDAPVQVRLDCAQEPTGHFAHVTAYAERQLSAVGIGFRVNPRALEKTADEVQQ